MMKPAAIVRFEQLWWGSLIVWLVATAIAWARTQFQAAEALGTMVRSQPNQEAADQLAKAAKVILLWSQPVTIAIVVLITLLVWFLAARRASAKARWLAAAVAMIAVLRVAMLLIGSIGVGMPAPVTVALFVLAAALDVGGVVQLFRADTQGWFGLVDADDMEVAE